MNKTLILENLETLFGLGRQYEESFRIHDENRMRHIEKVVRGIQGEIKMEIEE